MVAANTDAGIVLYGTTATLIDSVVRGTLPNAAYVSGEGIFADTDDAAGQAGTLTVMRSLVDDNTNNALVVLGVETVVRESIFRSTLPNADGNFGRGIEARCHLASGSCAPLHLEYSLVLDNASVGIAIFGIDATVVGTAVLDTRSDDGGLLGRGINVQCQPDVDPVGPGGACGRLTLDRTLIARSHEMGLFIDGAHTQVTASAMRDTAPRPLDDAFGLGLYVQCSAELGQCGSLSVTNSLIADSDECGISIYGVPTKLHGVAVLDTQPTAHHDYPGDYGQPLYADCDPVTGSCSTLDATNCRLAGGATAGIVLRGVSGTLLGSTIATIVAQQSDGRYGYGVQIEGEEDPSQTVVNVTSCLIEGASLAGLFFAGASGTLQSSIIRDGQFTVVMNQGSLPNIPDDNALSGLSGLSGLAESELMWTSMDPYPAPPPALPMSLGE